MSTIIAIKYNKGVLVGADMQTTGSNLATHNSKKIVKSKYSNTIIGTVGDARQGQVIKAKEDYLSAEEVLNKQEVNLNFMITKVVPRIFTQCINNLFSEKKELEELDTNVMFCTNDNIYVIESNGYVYETNDYAATGCGTQLVYGYLQGKNINHNTLTLDEAKEIIKEAIIKGCEKDVYVDNNLYFLSTEK